MAQAMRQLDLTSDLQASWWGLAVGMPHEALPSCRAAPMPAWHDLPKPVELAVGGPASPLLANPPCSPPLFAQPCFLSVSPYHLPDMTDRQWRKLFAEWSHAPVVGCAFFRC